MYTLVFSDRDGTINLDKNFYLGSSSNWREQVSFLDGVVDGIKLINQIPNSRFFILTNQSGVALEGGNFDNLTFERMHEVNRYILDKLRDEEALVDHYYACPFVDSNYVKKALEKGRRVDQKYIRENCLDLKPNIGMIEKALTDLNVKKEDCKIYMIGDRFSDVQMGLNIGGTGILVESYKTRELGDRQKVEQLKGDIFIAKDFLDAAKYIYNNSKNNI
ncbi:HAD-IIIA family hydrolase [Candidatus Woesearchaeota archaeon]|jgi:D-glycero-D-manno-heptose 1,7-bisphosphate phosphatase|nr:HAD-IIIA family hydrolase [Candidatus Woesearchaeota archaeon]MBT4387071.1 HAD-IIIA family hydrolase [Candidatus Woesearchaeota archaeon]MBT4596172.1 HAD-IIIA family hydrolase [Candidatus Woesearchaeota archaeon]MBT5741605.1 HAD-IIIA family hydrolase [Candidatus Woesearchaeota archaeon]MBT6505426.1 HAD-IIIA family hydrolase [Candidatus Woesearchaeota archaeon]